MNDLESAQEALRDRERELSLLVDMVPGHLWRLTPEGEPSFFSKRMVDFLGVDVAHIDKPGTSRHDALMSFIHPEDTEDFNSVLGRSLATGTSFALRYRLRRSDGVYRWMSSRAEPMRDEHGRIVQWYGLCHDVDDQVHAEEALRKSERRLQQLLDTVPASIWSTAPDGTPLYRNRRHTRVTGAALNYVNTLDGKSSPLAFIAHPDDRAETDRARAHAFETGTSYVVRYRQIRGDGTYRWTESKAEPLRDESGEILQWYGVSVDIDDLVTTQEALRERERELSQLIDAVPALIWCLTPDGQPSYYNKRLVQWLGASVDGLNARDVVGVALGAATVVHPNDAASVHEDLARCVRTGASFTRKYRVRRNDGVYRWMEGRAEPLFSPSGNIVHWYGVLLDIEDETRAQEELMRAQDRLARAAQAASLAELSASIAHEVNQPLAAIVANSHACQRWLTADTPNLERAQKTVERIIRDANSAADVVNRIRALFKQSVQTRAGSTISGVIAEVRDLMAEQMTRHRVRLDVLVENDLPLVACDHVQIQQVLMNLIRNGMDAMEDTTGDKVLELRARRIGDVVQTEVSDRGRGVEFPDKIFEPFFTTKGQGMGMGLAISRSIVESHGGRLWADKNDPCGAVFVFTLPVGAQTAP